MTATTQAAVAQEEQYLRQAKSLVEYVNAMVDYSERSSTLVITIASGWASQYDVGVMERVIPIQQHYGALPVSLPQVNGYIAVRDCAQMGQIWLIRPQNGNWERFLVADCAGSQETRDWMTKNRILVEVDGKTARRWKIVGVGIRIEVGKTVGIREKRE